VTVPTYIQPDNTTQSASVYKAAIDAATAVNAQIGAAFAAHEAATPNMTVVVDAGIIGGLEVAEQTSSTITAPTTNPRNDIATINLETGDLSIITGAEAATPVDPDIPLGEIAICRIELDNSPETTSITNTIIDNLRGYIITKENLGIYMSGWDISSSNYLEKQFSVSTQIVAPEGIVLSNDGTKMYAVDSVGEVMYQYTLDPAWDLSTAVYAERSFSVAAQDVFMRGLAFSSDGKYFYTIGQTNDKAYQYSSHILQLT
jgi:DNA-binding beta-propeller fold protein YncE